MVGRPVVSGWPHEAHCTAASRWAASLTEVESMPISG